MHLLVHLVALVQIRAVVGEARFHLRVGELPERAVPQHAGSGAGGQFDQRLPVALSQLTVDEQVQIEQVLVGAVRRLVGEVRNQADDGGDHPPQETVAQCDARPPEIAREAAVIELGARFVAGGVRGAALDGRSGLVRIQGKKARRRFLPARRPSGPG